MTTKRKCPNCGSSEVVPIVFGLPGPELSEAAARGDVVLGGCIVGDVDPNLRCRSCEHEWVGRPMRVKLEQCGP